MAASVGREQRHTRHNRCRICGGADEDPRGEEVRCGGYDSEDGLYCRCSRAEYAGALAPDDYGLYRHRMRDLCHCGQRHGSDSPRAAKAAPEAVYDYVDEHGDLIFQVVRFPGKQFRQRTPTPDGSWTWRINGARRVLYRLPELIGGEDPVYLVEGEKDTDRLRALGHTATTSSGGAGKWRLTDSSHLDGRTVIIVADADDVGRKHARDVVATLTGPHRLVESPIGKDISDHLDAGGTLDSLVPMREAAEDAPPSVAKIEERRPALRLAEPDARPQIVTGTDLERMTDQAIAAISKDARVYQRGGMLSGVVNVPEGPRKSPVERAPGSSIIVSLDKATVCELLSSAAAWTDHKGNSKMPPAAVVGAVMSRRQWPVVRPIMAVAHAPVLRPDGSVLQEPGYDEATGILYEPTESYPEVPESPRVDDARGALAALREVVCDFPFARPEHESGWVAGVLTLLARAAIDGGVPMFAIDATTRGTGKSRLVDAAVQIATGRPAPRTAMPDDDDEMRKRITSLVLDGDAAVCIDNVNRPLILPSLEAALTSATWKDRMLGRNATVSAPHRITWWATGNNLALSGDLARRSIHVRLESALENPEERTGFRHPELLAWVARERRRLVVCGLTLLRAYALSGARYQGPLWGSFEAWTRLVPAAIVWAGGADPMLGRATQDEAIDDEKRSLAVLIEGLSRLCPEATPLSAKAILSALYPEHDPHDGPRSPDGFDDLRDVIEQETRALPGRTPEARRLGKWLQKARGRVVSGWRLARHSGPNHSATWLPEPVT